MEGGYKPEKDLHSLWIHSFHYKQPGYGLKILPCSPHSKKFWRDFLPTTSGSAATFYLANCSFSVPKCGFSSSALETEGVFPVNHGWDGDNQLLEQRWDNRKDTVATPQFHSAAGNPNMHLMKVVCTQSDKSTPAVGTKKGDALHFAGVEGARKPHVTHHQTSPGFTSNLSTICPELLSDSSLYAEHSSTWNPFNSKWLQIPVWKWREGREHPCRVKLGVGSAPHACFVAEHFAAPSPRSFHHLTKDISELKDKRYWVTWTSNSIHGCAETHLMLESITDGFYSISLSRYGRAVQPHYRKTP